MPAKSGSMPLAGLITSSPLPVITEPIVKLAPSTAAIPLLLLKVIPRLVLRLRSSRATSVPPFKRIKLGFANKSGADPKLLSLVMANTPALIVVRPL